jgi:hypothetical protein
MGKKRRCPHCWRLYMPDARAGDRQRTCGRETCRREHKQQYDRKWRRGHPDYYRGSYPQQKEVYGSRSEYKRKYRQSHPDYVRRNGGYVRAWRRRKADSLVSPTSCDLRVTLRQDSSWVAITGVSHASRDIYVSLCRNEAYKPVTGVSPTSSDSALRSCPLS